MKLNSSFSDMGSAMLNESWSGTVSDVATVPRRDLRSSTSAQRARLDALDLQILEQLQRDAKQTNLQLAERIALSPSACLARVRRLEKIGVITGYQALLGLGCIGSHVRIIVYVTLEHHRANDFRAFDRVIARIPEVIEAFRVNGSFDYALTIVCRDIERFREINDQLVDDGLGVHKVESHVVLSTVRSFKGYSLPSVTKSEA
jgi:Lrp/AsnC family transcriptional regulator, leucine-responsive regulatory protein